MTVDTLSLAQQLREAELTATQAEAIAAAIGRSVLEGSATKADLEQAKVSLTGDVRTLRSDLERIRAELHTEIEKLRSTLIMWVVGTNLTFAAIIIAANKL